MSGNTTPIGQCEQFEWLSAYVDEELDGHARDEMEAHLFQCDTCRSTYRDLRTLRNKLRADPPAETLPARLDITLSTLTGRFLDEEGPVRLPSGYTPNPGEGAGNGSGSRSGNPWRQLTIAASIALLAVIGMGIFAMRSGHVPTLSAFEHHISGLSSFGHDAMHTHLEHLGVTSGEPVDTPEGLENLLSKRLPFDVELEHDARVGDPLDARVVEVDGLNVAMVDYRMGDTAVSLFLLPREVAFDKLELDPPEDPAQACNKFDVHQCYSDEVGTSICVQTWRDKVRLWVAHMPQDDLNRLVAPPVHTAVLEEE